MVARAHQLLELNSRRAMQSTTGDLARGRNLWVYAVAVSRAAAAARAIVETMLGEPAASGSPTTAPVPVPVTHRPRSLRLGWSAGRGPGASQRKSRSDSAIGTSLMLACRRAIRPLSANCQFSLP